MVLLKSLGVDRVRDKGTHLTEGETEACRRSAACSGSPRGARVSKGEASQATAAADGLWLWLAPWGTSLELAVMFSALWLCGGWGGDLVGPGLWGTGVQVHKEWALKGGQVTGAGPGR